MAGPGRIETPEPESLYASVGGGMTRRVTFAPGTEIFAKGALRDNAYIIDRGEVHIKEPDNGADGETLCVLGAGEIFGEMAMIDGGPRTASARVVQETGVFVIPRTVFEKRLDGLDPLISLFIALLIERYRVSRIHLPESIKQDAVGDLLEKLQKTAGVPGGMAAILDAERQREIAMRDLRTEQELRVALMNRQFVPFLQPILEFPARRTVGFEALIRWDHPQRGIVAPFEFIPVAERTSVVQLLDAMMLDKACENLARLRETAERDVFVSVNLSGINFETASLVEEIRSTLHFHDVNPAQIRLEITESALIADPDRAEDVLQGLKSLGLTIALDDFGTGYSSLGYLHKFSIDTLKIDRAFISNVDKDPKSLDIVRAINALAKTFKMKTVAEGIEREEEAVALSSIGCDMAQGYLFGKPMPVDEAVAFLRRESL